MSPKEAIDFTATLNIFPQGQGVMNVRKKNRSIQSTSGTGITLSGFLVGARRDIEWGGYFGYENDNYKVFKKSQNFKEVYVAGAARVRF